MGDHLDRCDLRRADRPLEEPGGSPPVTLGRDKDIDDLADLVDRAVDVAPLPGDLPVGLVDLPAVPDPVSAGPGRVGEEGREPLHPAVNGHVIDLDLTLGEQFLDISVNSP